MTQLERVRDLLKDPAKWTKGAFARDGNGLPVAIKPSGQAVAWCALGACLHLTDKYQDLDGVTKALQATMPFTCRSIADYNDFLPTHAALMAWLDRAIEHERRNQ